MSPEGLFFTIIAFCLLSTKMMSVHFSSILSGVINIVFISICDFGTCPFSSMLSGTIKIVHEFFCDFGSSCMLSLFTFLWQVKLQGLRAS